ncbi:MAG: ribosome biogenesis GTPase Der [Cyclobacteriaceae bacterium]|nr:ribosome biogenesis GTPase Der [Cyclobacteriaceae bacterium]MCH8517947.1 ribosome biogenesis GTPase Der [Cyclobacteriaceae bacterium]
MYSNNIIAIVGRPNVGKSTLFNRLIENKQAIMDDESGVTRDRHYGHGQWTHYFFSVVDTGGYVVGSEDIFEEKIREQVAQALDEADVVLFMVDVHTGLTGLDQDFAKILRQVKKPVIVVANKADTPDKMMEYAEFYALGFDQVIPISSASGSGTGELLDEVIKYFPDKGVENPDEGIPRISIMGRPNAGKSSFLNTILGTERSIVTDIAGTTRDTIHTRYKLFGKDFLISDTAGIRRKSRVKEDIEFYSVLRAIRNMESSDVAIIIIDAARGFESQDMNLVTLAHKYKKGIVLMVNKWDLIEKETNTARDFENSIREQLGQLSYIPIIFSSVLTKQRIFQVIEKAVEVYENLSKKVPTSELNDKLLPIIERNPPPSVRGKYIKIKYVTQLPTKTPTFAFFCNFPNHLKVQYTRFLEARIREFFDFSGVPIKIFFRKK